MTGAELIAAERRRQIEKEGWTTEHDDEHDDGSLALAAVCYASPVPLYMCDIDSRATVRFVDPWPDSWDSQWDKRSQYGNADADENESGIADPDSYTHEQRIDLLAKAGALIAAEIDRLQRANGVTVPREPTQAMLDAADKVLDADPRFIVKAWHAMLDAYGVPSTCGLTECEGKPQCAPCGVETLPGEQT